MKYKNVSPIVVGRDGKEFQSNNFLKKECDFSTKLKNVVLLLTPDNNVDFYLPSTNGY